MSTALTNFVEELCGKFYAEKMGAAERGAGSVFSAVDGGVF